MWLLLSLSLKTTEYHSDMKTCNKCGIEKEMSEYYAHKGMKDGYHNQCKSCSSIINKRNRIKNIKHIRKYDRERESLPNRKATKREAQRRYNKIHPERHAARSLVGYALNDGRLNKGPCLTCGSMFTEAHHPDYSKPLEVEWYCRQCHPR